MLWKGEKTGGTSVHSPVRCISQIGAVCAALLFVFYTWGRKTGKHKYVITSVIAELLRMS